MLSTAAEAAKELGIIPQRVRQLTPDALLTVKEAAEILGVSRRRVRILITEHRLFAQKFGWAWMIPKRSLSAVGHRPAGRPPKVDATGRPINRRRRRRGATR